MSDLQQRIEALYRSDLRGSALLIICLWATILFVLLMTWPYIPDAGIKLVVAIAAAAVLIFNTAAILAMVKTRSSSTASTSRTPTPSATASPEG